jgi:hypothetical protein
VDEASFLYFFATNPYENQRSLHFAGFFLLPGICCLGGNYTNFDVAIYIPVGAVRGFENRESFNMHLLPHSYAFFAMEK